MNKIMVLIRTLLQDSIKLAILVQKKNYKIQEQQNKELKLLILNFVLDCTLC